MEIFQRLNIEHGLTILLVTHEHDIAEYATRLVSFRDGRIRVDRPITARRTASADLAEIAAETEIEQAV
jgi:putative ABC transport system ATP-binding protein